MTGEPTKMHLPYADAPTQTNQVARCQVCGCQWQVRSEDKADARGCAFCDAPESAITIENEAPDYGDARIVTGSGY